MTGNATLPAEARISPQEEAQALANPMLQGTVTDTIGCVDAALQFMSSVFQQSDASTAGMTLSDKDCWGVSLILDTCRAALAHHVERDQEGGAA